MQQDAEMHQVAYALYSAELLLVAFKFRSFIFDFVILQLGFVFDYVCDGFVCFVYGVVCYCVSESYA
jgi:hypothetical protein